MTDYSSTYKYAINDDGWKAAHNSIIKNQKDLLATVKSLNNWLDDGEAVPQWAKANISRFANFLIDNIHHHHGNEENLIYPEIIKRCKAAGVEWPEKLTTDHPKLMKELDDVKAAVEALTNAKTVEADRAVQVALIAVLTSTAKDMQQHFAEEEENLLLVRRVMPCKVYKACESKIVKASSKLDTGAHFFTMDAETRKRYCKANGIPGIALTLAINPAMKHFQNTMYRNLVEVRADAHGLIGK